EGAVGAWGNRGSEQGPAWKTGRRLGAENTAEPRRAVSDIDRRRQKYIEQLLVGAGIAPPLAATRAQLLYWTYLGAALSRGKLSGERLDRMVAELKQIGLGRLPGKLAVVEDSQQHRLSRRQRR